MNTIQEKLQSLKPEPESLPYLRKCRVGERKAWTQEDNELFAKKRHRERQKELIKYFGVPLICHFCGKEVSKLKGHECDSLLFHSHDENHDNWDPENKTPSHFDCHTIYHRSGKKHTLETRMKMSKAHLGEKHWKWQGDKASAKTKWLREYRARKRREGSLRACNIF